MPSSSYNYSYGLKICCFFLHQQMPLHIAAGTEYVNTVECLAKLGAVITIKDINGVSVQDYRAENI